MVRHRIESRRGYRAVARISLAALLFAAPTHGGAAEQSTGAVPSTSPYQVVSGWHKPFAERGHAFGGNSGVFAESPNRILVAQRGETVLPDPVPPEFAGWAGSIGINVLREAERRVWLINETFHQIYVFSNDGSELLMTLGEKVMPGDDATHFARPQDVAFLPDGRILVADGLDNHRVVILGSDGRYLSEFGGHGEGPGQFQGVHAVAVGPGGRIFALDRSGGRINVFRTTDDPATVEFVDVWSGFTLPLDLIVGDDHLWMTDLGPLRFIKLDFGGNHLYTWLVPQAGPDGFLEAHSISVDADGNLYVGDNQFGRTQKLVPRPDADPSLLIGPPWVAR